MCGTRTLDSSASARAIPGVRCQPDTSQFTHIVVHSLHGVASDGHPNGRCEKQSGLRRAAERKPRVRGLHRLDVRLPKVEKDEHAYIRGNLGIRGPSLTDGLQALIAKNAEGTLSGRALDMPLRSLIAALEDARDLTPDRLEYVSRELGPHVLWRPLSERIWRVANAACRGGGRLRGPNRVFNLLALPRRHRLRKSAGFVCP
jgi:hypothetical protein